MDPRFQDPNILTVWIIVISQLPTQVSEILKERKKFRDLRNAIGTFQRFEKGQETMQTKNVLSVNHEKPWIPSKTCIQTNTHKIFILRAEVSI